jgi:hypothetical protein
MTATRSRKRAGKSAAAAALATALLTATAFVDSAYPYACAVLLLQLALVATWCLAVRPPGVRSVALVGALAIPGADAAAVWASRDGAGALVGAVAGAFILTGIAQMARGPERDRVTESFGSALTVAVLVVGLATGISLHRLDGRPDGVALTVTVALAAGAGIVLARIADLVLPRPAAHRGVHRGAAGPVLAVLAGLGTSGVLLGLGVFDSAALATAPGLVVGGFAGAVGALADLAIDYGAAEEHREPGEPGEHREPGGCGEPGEPGEPGGISGAVLGPLVGLALATPIGYLIGLIF